jgi:hypothetical protein
MIGILTGITRIEREGEVTQKKMRRLLPEKSTSFTLTTTHTYYLK